MDHSNNHSARNRRGVTIVEIIAVTGVVTMTLAMMAATIGGSNGDRLRTHSAWNLTRLSQGVHSYAADWEGRQWTAVPDELSDYDNIYGYNTEVRCLDSLLIGEDSTTGAVWGWYLGGALCPDGLPGGGEPGYSIAVFEIVYQPYPLDDSFLDDQSIGAHMFFNCRGFREYVSGSAHDSAFFQPGSRDARLNALLFEEDREFFGPYVRKATGSPNSQYAPTTGYTMSAAAMWNPEVHRAPSAGGWQDPRTIELGYRSPSLHECEHPTLKTMFVERWWIDGAPTRFHPDSLRTPTGPNSLENVDRYHWRFNQGHESRAMTAFYDGSVASVRVGDAYADDSISAKATGDGLWSRDSPMGEDGWRGDTGNGDGFSSFHVLTVDGIRGRDLLRRRDG